MNVYVVVLRLLHIVSGVFWAGVSFAMPLVIEPAVQKAGPAGGKFMGTLTRKSPFALLMSITGLLTFVSGVLLYLRDSSNFTNTFWMISGTGIVYAIGSIAGTIAVVIGLTVNRAASVKLGRVGAEIETAGGSPSSEQVALIGRLRERLSKASLTTAILLAVAVITMATAQYMTF